MPYLHLLVWIWIMIAYNIQHSYDWSTISSCMSCCLTIKFNVLRWSPMDHSSNKSISRSVAMTFLRVDSGRQNSFGVSSLTSEYVQAENMSMSQNRVQPGAPTGFIELFTKMTHLVQVVAAVTLCHKTIFVHKIQQNFYKAYGVLMISSIQ